MDIQNQITIFLPGFAPRTFDLDQFPRNYVLMGRGTTHGKTGAINDIQVPESIPFVSRAHCVFQKDDSGRWQIVDSHSANGIAFNGQRVASHYLNDGDKIYIGTDPNESVLILFSSRMEHKTPEYTVLYDGNAPVGGQSSAGVVTSTANKATDVVGGFSLAGVQRCVIGRAAECNIVLDHPTVSRQHCIIAKTNGQYYIYDNNSTNGVILNGQLLHGATPLNQMDRISIAGYSFIFCDECLYGYAPSGGVSLSVSELCKKVGKGASEKTITNDVNLYIEPNKFVAIIGGSGAGKTTLLNCMSGMTDFTSGEVLINGESIRTSGKSLRSLMGYVPQQDIVYDSLTLERMLWYSAKLRMPPDTSADEIRSKIDETLSVVELSDHRQTLISKLSGGERKRASIAVELLASPRLFFLDEPSSGLDPGTEKHLMQMLKRLSTTGKTVIMVTHTVQNLDLCDTVICMGRGGVLCYAGPPKDALRFFNKSKPTDIYDDLNENSAATADRFRRVAAGQPQNQGLGDPANVEKPNKLRKGPKAVVREFWVMTQRYVEILANNLPRLALLLAMPVFLTFLVCIAFQADGNFYNTLMSITGGKFAMVRETFPFLVATDTMSLMFAFSCAGFWVGIFNSIQEVSKERPIYEREKFAGVGSTPYVLSKFVPLTVLCFVQAVAMCLIVNLMSSTAATVAGNVDAPTSISYGMASDGIVLGAGLMWLENFITTFLCVLSAMCLGLMISTLVSNEMALVLCPVCLMPQILFAGVVSPLSGITKTISEIITCKWSCLAYFVSARINDLYKSVEYQTGAWERTTFSDDNGVGLLDAAYESTTEYVLGLNGVQSAWLIMGLMCIVCVIASVLILRFKPSKGR